MLNQIKSAIDNNQFPLLWHICKESPSSFFTKISVRQLGVRRLEALRIFLSALDLDKQQNQFYFLLSVCVEQSLGVNSDGQVVIKGGGRH